MDPTEYGVESWDFKDKPAFTSFMDSWRLRIPVRSTVFGLDELTW
jgi:hypothetical protein